MPAAPLGQRRLARWRDARRVARLRAPPAARALRRGDRPAGPDQVGADRAPGARRRATAWPIAPTAPATSGRRAGWSTHAIRVEPHSHALDRARELVARALATPRRHAAALRPRAARPRSAAASAHGRVRARHLARRQALAGGALDRARPASRRRRLADRAAAAGDATERERADRLAAAIGSDACDVWPALDLGALHRPAWRRRSGVIGVDSGPSHIAVALDLPHVQIYNVPTAVAHRAAGARTATATRSRSRPGRRRRSMRSGRPGTTSRDARAAAP